MLQYSTIGRTNEMNKVFVTLELLYSLDHRFNNSSSPLALFTMVVMRSENVISESI